MLLTCCFIWWFNMVQSELALESQVKESQVKDVSCSLNSLTVCTCIIPGTAVPELSLTCWFWTTSLHFLLLLLFFFLLLLFVFWQSTLQSVSVSFKTLCPFNMQVQHFMLVRCVGQYIFLFIFLKILLHPFLSEDKHIRFVSVHWVWM